MFKLKRTQLLNGAKKRKIDKSTRPVDVVDIENYNPSTKNRENLVKIVKLLGFGEIARWVDFCENGEIA